MKMRLLPQIDLVRAMPLDRIERKKSLEQISFFRPPLTYNPMRASAGDLMNMQPGIFSAVPATWKQIAHDVTNRSKHAQERDQNLIVAKLVHDDTAKRDITSFHQEFFPLKIGISSGVMLWNNFYFIDQEVPVFPFFDPRRTRGLNTQARNIVFSLMHQRIRVEGSDFESAEFAIYRFPVNDGDDRYLRIYTSEKAEFYPYDQLEQMIVEVYAQWEEVLAEREHEKRKSADGKRGALI
jgi:hypothetical protein